MIERYSNGTERSLNGILMNERYSNGIERYSNGIDSKTGLKWPILERFLNFKSPNSLENNEDAIKIIFTF